MEYRNSTCFPSMAFESVDGKGLPFHVAVLGATFAVEMDGRLRALSVQPPLMMADDFYGDPNTSTVRRESDLAPFKPWCDVILIGKAQAPGVRPLPRFETGIRLTHKGQTLVDKRFIVTGPRFWKKRLFGWRLGRPEAIHELPLRYDYAYGGECRIEASEPAARRVRSKYRLTEKQRAEHPSGPAQAPLAHTACPTNNLGMGFSERWYLHAKKLRRVPAPQIEALVEPIQRFGNLYLPQGLGVMGRAWRSRVSLCGTMDQEFIRSGRSLPEDFDYAYWNGAHPDLQLPWLKGGETIDLVNIPVAGRTSERVDSRSNRVTRLVLPELGFCGVTTLIDGRLGSHDLNLDTVVIDADKGLVHLTYRLKLPMNPAIESLEVEPLHGEERDILREHVQSVNERITLFQEAAR